MTTVFAWGKGDYGQLGKGTVGNCVVPLETLGSIEDKSFRFFDSGLQFSAAVTSSNKIYTWGYNASGQLGLGDLNSRNIPTQLTFFTDKTIKRLVAGYEFCIVETSDNQLYVWGANSFGQLGLGDQNNKPTPQLLSFFETLGIKNIVAGGNHTFVITESNEVYCFGKNDYGQLGIGNTAHQNSPTLCTGLVGKSVKAIYAGGFHTFAVLTDGKVLGWGCNNNGQLGLGDTTQRSQPTEIPFFSGMGVREFSAGYYFSACITDNGTLWVWGENNYGQLGLGDTTYKALPQQQTYFNAIPIKQVRLGDGHAAVLSEAGHVYVWGNNNYNQLGNGNTQNCYNPCKLGMPNMTPIRYIHLKGFHTFALTQEIDGIKPDVAKTDLSGALRNLYLQLKDNEYEGAQLLAVNEKKYFIYDFVVKDRCPIVMDFVTKGSSSSSVNNSIIELLLEYAYGDTITPPATVDEQFSNLLLDLYDHICVYNKRYPQNAKHPGMNRLELLLLQTILDVLSSRTVGSITSKISEILEREPSMHMMALRNHLLFWMKFDGVNQLKKTTKEQKQKIPQKMLMMILTGENITKLPYFTVPASTLKASISAQYNNPLYSDVTLILDASGTQKIFAHLPILQLRLPNIFTKEFVTSLPKKSAVKIYELLKIPESSSGMNLEQFFKYLYSGELDVTVEEALSLLLSWSKIIGDTSTEQFKKECEELVIGGINMDSVFNVMHLLESLDNSYEPLKQQCAEFCLKNWETLNSKHSVEGILDKISTETYIELNAKKYNYKLR